MPPPMMSVNVCPKVELNSRGKNDTLGYGSYVQEMELVTQHVCQCHCWGKIKHSGENRKTSKKRLSPKAMEERPLRVVALLFCIGDFA